MGRPRPWLAIVLALGRLILGVAHQTEPFNDFEVVIGEAGSLGAALSGTLQVERFYRDPKTGEPSRLQSRGVEAGDLLVAINAVPVEGMAPKDVRILLQAQSRPLRLVFRPHDEAPRVIPGLFAPEAPKSEDDIKAEGHMDVLDGPISLFSVPVTRAKFGGEAACERKLLVAADPADACGEVYNKVSGMYVMVERGKCSFATKAMVLRDHGALGMVLINSEAGRQRMGGEDVEARMGKGFSAPLSVMVSRDDGEKLRRALKAHRGHLYGRMVVTEECFRNEDEWHRVHDVAWKEHPHLPVTRTPQQPPAKPGSPIVTAKGVRLSHSAHDDVTGPHGALAGPKRTREEKVVVQEWDRRRGQLGKREAENQARTTRAQEQRQGQHLRSGVLELRSSNVTYIWEKGIWSNEDPQSVARVASGPIVARAEFLPSAFGGAISLGPRAVAAAWPVDECRNIDPLLPDNAIWVISMADTKCSLAQVIRLAQEASVSLLAITGTGYQDPRPRALSKEDMDSEVQSLVDKALWVPIVELTEDEGRHMLEHLTDPTAMARAEVVDRPEVLELWGILDKLQRPDGWPIDKRERRRLFQYLKQRHSPEAAGGSVGRYKYLVQAYERLVGSGGLGTAQLEL